MDERLRPGLMGEDWAAWAEAWRELDAGPVRELLRAAQQGRPVTLTLCGERHAMTLTTQPRTLWMQLRRRFQPGTPVLALLDL